ncbi:MAG: NAD-dependent epimerase/dehydratase family protein [Bryobacteraceae bacterium]
MRTGMYGDILITGGAGFVGSTLSIRLKSEFPSARVTALDNLHRRGSELNLPRLAEAGVQFVHGDVRSPDDLAAVPQPDLMIDCSAEPSAQAGYGGGSPGYLIHTNLTGCVHLLELARKAKSRFIFLSTSRVYPFPSLNRLFAREDSTRFTLLEEQSLPGASSQGIAEGFPLEGPRSLYGMTKLASELMVDEYADAYDLPVIINRFGLLSGPWQMAKSDQGVIALWVAAHYFKQSLAYIGFGGSGKQVRDALHVDDFCDLVVHQVTHFENYRGQRFNAGGGLANSLSLLETTRLCEEITGNRIDIDAVTENRPADVRSYVTDHRAVSAVSGWAPRRDTRAIVADICSWLRAEESRLRPLFYPAAAAS